MSEQLVRAPEFPESIPSGTLLAWLKNSGDQVQADEVIAEVETDKVVLEIYAPCTGQLLKQLCSEGDEIFSGQDIALIAMGKERTGGEVPAASAEPGVETQVAVASKGEADAALTQHNALDQAGPAARKLIRETGLDARLIKGTGRNGRITRQDVLSYQKNQLQQAVEAPAPPTQVPSAAQPDAPEKHIQTRSADSGAAPDRIERREPMSRLRRTIAQRLCEVGNNTAMLTTFNELDMSELKAVRAQEKQGFAERHGVKLGFMSFFVAAAVNALREHPAVNASIDGEDVVYHGYQDIGVAVSSKKGLVVPVLRNAQTMGLADIERGIVDLSGRAQNGRLTLDELQGGTFTISNGGVFGSMMSTPILNPPQTGVLGMHNIIDRPVAIDGEVVIRPMMYLALTYDHRLLDGRDAVTFLVRIKELLESPVRLLL